MSKSRKHTKTEHLTLFGLRSHIAPVGLLLYAESYLQMVKSAHPLPDRPFQPAPLFLASRSLELALKTFLCLKGETLEKLAVQGHNLGLLLTSAKANGLGDLVSLPVEQEAEIERASIYYAEKVYEYPAVKEAVLGYPALATVGPLVAAAEALISALRPLALEA